MTLSEFFNEHVARVLEVVFAPADALFRAMPPWSWTACAVALLLMTFTANVAPVAFCRHVRTTENVPRPITGPMS